MPSLEELLTSQSAPGSPGVNPEIEQMLGRLTQLQSPMKGPGGGMPPAPQPAQMQGTPMSQGTPNMLASQGMAQPMAPEQANVTYQMLIKAGVPPEIAKQAIAEPKFLQEILKDLQGRQQQTAQQPGIPPQAQQAAGMGQGGPQRLAPPMG